MCEQTNKIKFCTCSELENVSNGYIWELYQHKGERSSNIMGKMLIPEYILKDELTSEFVEKQLNEENLFDFEYKPQEKDAFVIKDDSDSWSYMQFIYKNGKWKFGHFSIKDITIKIKSGCLIYNK